METETLLLTTICWPAGYTYFFSSPSPSSSGSRWNHVDHAFDCHLQRQVVMLDMLQVFSGTIIGAHMRKQQGSLVLSKDWTNLGSLPTMPQMYPSAKSWCLHRQVQVSSWGPLYQPYLARTVHWRQIPIFHLSLSICRWRGSHPSLVQEITSLHPSPSGNSPFLNLVSTAISSSSSSSTVEGPAPWRRSGQAHCLYPS